MKSIPLKIYDRRKEAKDLIETIKYFDEILSEAMRINLDIEHPRVRLSGRDSWGEAVGSSCSFVPDVFKEIRHTFIKSIGVAKRRRERLLAEIPDAKVIPVDFTQKKIDPDRNPTPQTHKKNDIDWCGNHMTIYRGAYKICKDISIKPNEIPYLVQKKGLPAFKIKGKKHWYAFPYEIEEWKRKEQAKIN